MKKATDYADFTDLHKAKQSLQSVADFQFRS